MTRPVSTLAFLLILSALATAGSASAEVTWASFRGPGGIGEATGLPPGDGPLAFELRWKRPLGSGYSGVAVTDDFLVTASYGGERDYVVALDPETGEEQWRYDLAPGYAGHDGSHDGPISTPAIAEKRVFAVSPWGHVAAIDLETGEEIWTKHLVDDLGSEKPFYGFGSSPNVVDGVMVLQTGGQAGSVTAFDAATGEIRWRAIEDEIAAESPMIAEIGGQQQIIVLGTKLLAGLDPKDGTVIWQLEHGGGDGAMGAYTASPLLLGDDRILVKADDNTTAIVEVASRDGEMAASIVETSKGMTKSYSPPSRTGERVYGYTARFLSAIDTTSGELLWRSREPGDGFQIVVGDHLAVITKKGTLHLGAARPEGWRETTRLDLFDDLAWTPPSYAKGSLYLRSLGEIARVDLVRVDAALIAETSQQPLPPVLAGLAATVAATEDPAAAVDAFLAGKDLPLIKGREVVFLWRGEAEDLAIAGDMIGMRTEEPMQRLEGTDLWWWATEIDPRARISYLFYVDYEPTVDPTHDRVVESAVLGPDMNWRREEGVQMSWFAMPQWPGHRLARQASLEETGSTGTLDTFDLAAQPPAGEDGEQPEPLTIPMHVWLPPGYAESTERYPVAYVHHYLAREIGAWPQTLDRVVGKTTEPFIAVFLEFPPLPPQAEGQIFVQQLVPEIDKRYRTLTEREHRAVVGMGWSGLGAALTTFFNSDTFGLLGVQSFFSLEETMDMLVGAIGDTDASTLPMKIYLEWGRWDLISPHEEMNMRASSREVWNLFEEKGWDLMGGEVWDSTDFASWRNRTGTMLEALFPLDGAEPSLVTWQTSAP